MEILNKINQILALPLVGLVVVYQKTFSPDHGLLKAQYPRGFCKFHPTCSEYARQILLKDGLRGLPKVLFRVGSCNPLTSGGIDLP